MSEIKPALTAEEWEGYVNGALSVEPWTDGSGRLSIYLLDQGEVLSDDGELEVCADASVELTPEDRHALAAHCLHGQPSGFTWTDVDNLRGFHGFIGNSHDTWGLLRTADRIAALLPPRAP